MTSANDSPTLDVPLYRLAQARSGDKGDTSDITVFFPNAELFRLCDEQLKPDSVRRFLSPLVRGTVDRYSIPKLFGYKFVCHQALDGGGSSSLRSDNLGKSMASALLRMWVHDIPAALAESSPLFAGPPRKEQS
jgi:hypothetical protein